MPEKNDSPRYLTCGPFSGVLEEVPCPICDSPPEPRLVFRMSNGVGVWICPGCGIMYASPRFTEESLLRIYEEDAFIDPCFYEKWSYEKWKNENINRSYVSQVLKLRLVRRFLQQNDRILDVGCGSGLFCVEALKQGVNVEGIDPSKMLVELGRKTFNFPLHLGELKDFNPGYRYKGIVIWAVLEHVYDLMGMVRECNRLLEQGGYLFIDVPNHEGLSNRFKTFLYRIRLKKSEFKHFGFPWHVYSFNRKSLCSLIDKSGFEPVVFEFWSHLMKEGADGPFARLAIKLTQRFEFSDYVTLVARKKENC